MNQSDISLCCRGEFIRQGMRSIPRKPEGRAYGPVGE